MITKDGRPATPAEALEVLALQHETETERFMQPSAVQYAADWEAKARLHRQLAKDYRFAAELLRGAADAAAASKHTADSYARYFQAQRLKEPPPPAKALLDEAERLERLAKGDDQQAWYHQRRAGTEDGFYHTRRQALFTQCAARTRRQAEHLRTEAAKLTTPAGGEAPEPKPKEAPLTHQVTIVNHGPNPVRLEKQSRDADGRYQAAYEELVPALSTQLVTLAEGESLQVLPGAGDQPPPA